LFEISPVRQVTNSEFRELRDWGLVQAGKNNPPVKKGREAISLK